jgi:predicted RNA binding protein YcfA (HicA-like mRNA interferase family)
MKLPRNLSARELVTSLRQYGYMPVRQEASHLRLTTQTNGEHHVTIPMHNPLKPGTLNNILKSIAEHIGVSREELLKQLFS